MASYKDARRFRPSERPRAEGPRPDDAQPAGLPLVGPSCGRATSYAGYVLGFPTAETVSAAASPPRKSASSPGSIE